MLRIYSALAASSNGVDNTMIAKPPMKRDPLTAEEKKAEFDYRLKERLYMLAPDGKPTEEQRIFAQAEAMRELRRLNEK